MVVPTLDALRRFGVTREPPPPDWPIVPENAYYRRTREVDRAGDVVFRVIREDEG